MKDNLTRQELEVFCSEYDEINGRYPESPYEGKSVFSFIIKKLLEQEAQTK